MKTRVPWSQLKEMFSGEWVELVSYDWPWGAPHPRWGIVRCYAPDRQELMEKIEEAGALSDSLVLYIAETTVTVTHHENEGAAL
jgi:hypothetical protein